MIDLRTPSGWFFLLIGATLIGMGVLSPSRAALTDVNVNLFAGGAMFAFGLFLLVLARRRA